MNKWLTPTGDLVKADKTVPLFEMGELAEMRDGGIYQAADGLWYYLQFRIHDEWCLVGPFASREDAKVARIGYVYGVKVDNFRIHLKGLSNVDS